MEEELVEAWEGGQCMGMASRIADSTGVRARAGVRRGPGEGRVGACEI